VEWASDFDKFDAVPDSPIMEGPLFDRTGVVFPALSPARLPEMRLAMQPAREMPHGERVSHAAANHRERTQDEASLLS
jgi:hypothetical protein